MADTGVDRPPGRWPQRLLSRYHAIASLIDRIMMGLAGLLVVAAVLATATAVVARRYPAFPDVPWAAEATTMCVIGAVLLVVPQGLRRNSHLAVTILTERLGTRSYQVIVVINQILAGTFFALLTWSGLEMAALQQEAHSPMLGLSLLWPYVAIAVSSILMLFETAVRLTEALLGRAPRPDGHYDNAPGSSGGSTVPARQTIQHGGV